MQKLLMLVLAVAMLSAAFVGVASAQQNPNIFSFTREANYMSLSGYDRYRTHLQTGKWTLRTLR